MVISSRTPEGRPGKCPVCGHTFRLEPSSPLCDATCPACNSLVLCISAEAEVHLFHADRAVLAAIAEALAIPVDKAPELRELLDLDSIDAVELVMALEDRGHFGDDPSPLMG